MKAQKRDKVKPTPYRMVSEQVRENAIAFIRQMPIDPIHPIEVVIREEVKKRKLTMNQAMWAGPLADIERYGWYKGCQFPADIWHEHFKTLFLPDENAPDFDPEEVLDGYGKWGVNPWTGERVLRGSTTQLTDKGMIRYLIQMEAEASQEHGVTFTERNEYDRRCA